MKNMIDLFCGAGGMSLGFEAAGSKPDPQVKRRLAGSTSRRNEIVSAPCGIDLF